MQNKKKKLKRVVKPYVKGAPFERSCLHSVLGMFGATAALAFGFMIVGGMMMWENVFMRLSFNTMLLLCGYMLFFYVGTSRGTTDVNHGEILYQRREEGKNVSTEEVSRSFHPLKGFLIGLLGSLPILLCGVGLALLAKKQLTTAGVLPSWVSSMNMPELTAPLTAYQRPASMSLEGVLRVIVRMALMPLINIIGVTDRDRILLLERLSPLLLLLPGLSYGIGYSRGVQMRSAVHTNIAAAKRRQARKQRNAKRQAHRDNGPERLN